MSKEKLVNEAELQAMVSGLTTHYKKYYTVKWAGAHEDVLAFFSPAWLSPFENACLWVTGWKPSMVFQVIDRLRKTTVMSEEQVKKIEELRVKIRLEKEKVERAIERQQMSMADRRMVELAQLASRPGQELGRDGSGGCVGRGGIEGVAGWAGEDYEGCRLCEAESFEGGVEVLNPLQCVDFLAAICMLQVRLRQRGKKRSREPE